ncbi:AprI/Inh family metalloprotease inhibitor [Polycladidibacter stylochi]|uniref:AprI/Inh family metalloprotease inhibitor n=1 Tax=Polycladidibacter stylochi TaxID=1807766 RepID=UPI0008371ACD|nr:AprI/Inh family metalloprotease inhibitor [Pseudovibrio stylochi]
MNRSMTIALVSLLAVSTAACMRTSYTRSYVSPLPATPVPAVTPGELQPVSPAGQPVQAAAAPETQIASAPPATQRAGLGRTDLLGGWTVASGGDNCKLFMTLTTWSGGYRANTRGCNDPSLSSIAAWNLNGNQVVLKDAAGGNLATLSGGGAAFSGQTVGGAPISFQR